jgi:hypothetical protein
MLRKGILRIVAAAAIVGIVPAAEASMLRSMSLAELVSQADDIVVAKVVSVSAAWDPAHRRILSTIEIDVEEAWKGSSASRHLTIVQPGGSVGDIEMTVHGMPTFSVAERALLFLRRIAEREVVVGMSEGKRSLRWSPTSNQWFVDSPDSACTVEPSTEGNIRHVAARPSVGLDSIRAEVRALVSEK